MATAVEKIILKHYRPTKKPFNNLGWEQCGREVQKHIQNRQDFHSKSDRFKTMTYLQKCDALDKIRKRIEQEYEKFFSFDFGMYDWINGNSNLKDLIEDNSKK